ncbi:MAG: alpha/beta fold hydrolase [Propionibacteriaceae bacterium]|jgi:multidrug/hemolysin transport system ATP-binding protein|nr:alpha/beta fold hydrolase [Propionibacteriaceae bacterium]
MPWLEVGGTRAYHQILNPAGVATVVMVHGLFTNHTVFLGCGAKALADAGYRVVLYDLRGHGLSEVPETGGFSLTDLGVDLFGLMDALGIETADVVGYSLGAAIAVKSLLAWPERFRSLTVIEGFGLDPRHLDLVSADPAAIRASLTEYTRSTGIVVSERQAGQVEAIVNRLVAAGLPTDLSEDQDLFATADLPSIDKPVLLLYGEQSPYLVDGQLLANRIPGARLLVTRGDHQLPVTRRDWVRRQLVAFIGRLGAGAPVVREPAGSLTESGAEVAIRVQGLTMAYGRLQAVKGISFEVARGSFFAFLGVHGAGKSTTINCQTTLLRPTGGTAEVAGLTLGRHNGAIRHHIGVVFQGALLDPRLTVRENLRLRGRLHRLDRAGLEVRIAELVELLEMGSFANRQYRFLSGGQKRRADIARALIHRPDVLFLDEPTAGLDPHSREQVWNAIADVRNHEGMTVFLTTHYMAETERADMVCIIDEGSVIAQGTPAQLRADYSRSELSLRLKDEATGIPRLTDVCPDVELSPSRVPGEPLRVPIGSADEVKWLLPYLWDQIADFEYRHGSMDDVFLNLTGHRGGDAEAPVVTKRRRKRAGHETPEVAR